MTTCLLGGALIASLLAGFLLATELRFLIRRINQMSASLDRLKSAVVAVAARVSALETQPVGTPDSELDAISSQLEALASPTIPAPAPAAE